MKYAATILLAFTGIAAAAPALEAYSGVAARLRGREVPQEHSHNGIIQCTRDLLFKNNPLGVKDPIFALLGNAAAAAGLGKATDTNCLQAIVADQAFTNAKSTGDVAGMTCALQFRALERNTPGVGVASAPCTSFQPVNPEIAILAQHQDPASPGAADINKKIVLELARQIASVGGDPQLALKTGTFKPGNVNDPTGKGNTCDDQNDPIGCIFTNNLIVDDATAAEISNAVSGVTPKTNVSDTLASSPSSTSGNSCPARTSAPATSGKVATSQLNLGSCTDPSIVFGPNFDGRTQNSFEPVNKKDFNHGSALNIGVICSFICDRLHSPCAAPDATLQACAAASAAASKASGQAAADTWNSLLGLSASNSSTGTPPQAVQSSTPTVDVNKATTTPTKVPNSFNSTQSSVSGTNVQIFTGTLGGAAPAVIFTAGSSRPFNCNGDTFVGKGAALQRSCAIQHNACADAANSGKLPGGVGQCDAQQTACNNADKAA